MSLCANLFSLLLFFYTTTGIPLGDKPQIKGKGIGEAIHSIPSQWGKDSQITYQWPKGEVPYVFDDQSYDDGVKDRVRIAMAALERDSCIRFKEQKGTGDGAWLHFTNPETQRQCVHEPSFQAGGEIRVVLGYDCLKQRDIMHSVMHGVGFRDEVSHPQRDLFVKIMWGNIQSAYKPMFRIQPVDSAGGLVEYDPMSIMHFHDRAYSLNGQATITALLPGLRIEPSDKLSHLDKMKLRIMFGHECNKRKVGEVLNKCKGILTEYDEADLTTTTKPDDDNTQSNEGATDDPNDNIGGDKKGRGDELQETIIVGNDASVNNNGDQKGMADGSQEITAVGDDASVNNNGDQKEKGDGTQEIIAVGDDASVNNHGDQNENVNGIEETIIVGNDKSNGNTNNEDVVNDNQDENLDNVESVQVNNGNTIDNINVGANQELVIVGLNENPIDSDNVASLNKDNKDAKPSSEAVIVSNAHKDGAGDVSNDNKGSKENNEAIIFGNDDNANKPAVRRT